jgi:hypothetical protein
VAYIIDGLSIRLILDHPGLSPLEKKPLPDAADLELVPVDDEAREIGSRWAE